MRRPAPDAPPSRAAGGERAETPEAHADRVARHYDVLDPWYRLLWGEHLHHGLWTRGDEGVAEATEALVARVVEEAGIGPGSEVVDLGSGYGATARLLARRWGVRATAVTLSPVQHAHALAAPPVSPAPDYRLGDFTAAGLPASAFDAVLAVESLSHVSELGRVLAEARRVLRPGGRFVACVWLSGDAPGRLRRRWLVDPVVREGRLARLAPATTYRAAMEEAGLEVEGFEDLTERVRRTWSICLLRVAGRLLRDSRARRLVLGSGEWEFARTVPRLLVAYRVGAVRYGLFRATAPRTRAAQT